MSSTRSITLDDVLARIDAPALPDADVLADIPLDELERQLARLGVDVSGEMDELLSAAGVAPRPVPLERLGASDLAALSVDEVEARLRQDGVDVAGYLARAQSMIRKAAQPGGDGSETRRRAVPHAAAVHGSRRSRRVPQAIAASLVAISVAGVVFTVVHQQGSLTAPTMQDEDFAPQASAETHLEAPLTRSTGVTADRVQVKQSDGVADEDAPARSWADDRAAPAADASAESGAMPRDRTKEQVASVPVQSMAAAGVETPPSTNAPEPRPETAHKRAAEMASMEIQSSKVAQPPGGMREDGAMRVLPSAGESSGDGTRRRHALADRPASAGRRAQPPLADREERQTGALVTAAVAAGQDLASALREVTMAREDRDALLALLSREPSAESGTVVLMLDGERVVSASLQRGPGEPVRVWRAASGALTRVP